MSVVAQLEKQSPTSTLRHVLKVSGGAVEDSVESFEEQGEEEAAAKADARKKAARKATKSEAKAGAEGVSKPRRAKKKAAAKKIAKSSRKRAEKEEAIDTGPRPVTRGSGGGSTDDYLIFMSTMKAAEHGDVLSQYHAGCHYETGLGCEQSYERAVEWFEKAALQGFADAEFNLANLLKEGRG